MAEQNNLIIDIREKPGIGKGVILSFQHVFAMFGATVLVPVLTGLPVNTALLASGIGTLIYILCTKAQVPVYLGSSFAYITAIISALAIETTSGNPNFAAVATGLMGIGLVYVVIAIIVALVGKAWLSVILPPIVVGPMIAVIGLGLAGTAVGMAGLAPSENGMNAQHVAVALISMLSTALIAVHAKKFFKIVPIITGIGIGFASAIIIDLIFNLGGETMVVDNLVNIGKDIAKGHIIEVPKIMLPFGSTDAKDVGPFTLYALDFSAFLAILPIAFVTIAEHIGDHTVLGKICNRDFLQKPGLNRTLLGDGIATFVAGMIGGPANTTYGENTGVVGLTRVGSVYVTGGAAVIAVLMSFLKPVKDLISAIPTPVMGGISIILFGFIAANGLRVIAEAKIDFSQTRNIIIPAVMLVLGLGGASFQITKLTAISGMALAAVAGIILNMILPSKKEEQTQDQKETKKAKS